MDYEPALVKHLPLTLLAFDNREPSRTLNVLRHCMTMFTFDEVRLVSAEPVAHAGVRNEICEPRYAEGYAGAMWWEIAGVAGAFDTSHALFVSTDGFIRNPDRWDPDWLSYDMIGSPWPAWWHTQCYDDGTRVVQDPLHRVGNSGFCLRSKRFAEAVAERAGRNQGELADVFACQTLAPELSAMGVRYAPPGVAGAFSFEHPIEEGTAGPESFGFHGCVSGRTQELIDAMLLPVPPPGW